jgi:hypothetical protein
MMNGDLDALARRVAALEEAVAALRDTVADGGDTRPSAPGSDERFWALAGLRERVDEPGAVLFTGTVRLPTDEHVEWQQSFGTDGLLDTDWAAGADTLAALGQPVRLLLLREVLRGVRTTAELGAIEALGTSGQLHHHLRQLVASGWLRSTGRGRYEVPATRVVPLLVVIAAAQR